MHQQRVQRIADRWPLHLGVIDDGHRLVHVGAFINVGVADAYPAGNRWHAGLFRHGAYQSGAAARYNQIDDIAHRQHMVDEGAVGVGHELDGTIGHAGIQRGVLHHTGQGAVGAYGLLASPEEHRVAGLQAERGDINGHVGAALVNGADDAQRHPFLADEQPVGLGAHVENLADGVGQCRHVEHIAGG